MKAILYVASLSLVSIAALAGCSKPSEAAVQKGEPQTSAAAPAGDPAEADAYKVALTVAPCKSGADCEATISLTAKNGFHLNDKYPTKFAVDEAKAKGITFPANTFKPDTALVPNQTSSTITVKFKPSGDDQKLAGTVKLGVCNESTCQNPAVSLEQAIKLAK